MSTTVRRAAIAAFALGILHAPPGFAQSPSASAPLPAFELASLKPSGPEERSIGMFTYPGGRVVITRYTLKMLISDAYGVQMFQIQGGPKWANEDVYSIVAKPPADSKSAGINPSNPKLPPPEEELSMLRSLLATRFQLTVHEETKEGAVYALVLGSQGPKLTGAKDKEDFPVVTWGTTGKPDRPYFMRGYNASMARLAARLAIEFKRPVLDQTGLPGAFDFIFQYAGQSADAAEGPSLFTAIQELGLKLVSTRGPIRQLVIDRAEKPTAN